MLSNNDMLLIALGLSILGYNIGAMLLMLPIPLQGVKRWGPILMRDAIYSAILIASAHIILNVIPYMQRLLGVSWSHFTLWMTGRIAWLAGWKAALSTLMAAASKILGGFFMYTVLDPLSRMVNYALTTMYSILSVSVIVKSCYAKLVLLGILLFSVPFRLTRAVGSYLIAFSIVFMIGLPFMPMFITSFTHAPTTPPPSGNCDFGVMYIEDAVGERIAYPVVEGVNSRHIIIFRYMGDRNGVVLAGFPDKGLPANQSYTVLLDYLGVKTTLLPNPVYPARDYSLINNTQLATQARVQVTLKDPLLIREPLPLVAIYRSENVYIPEITLGKPPVYVVALTNESNCYIEVRAPSTDIVNITYNGGVSKLVIGNWSWMGLEGKSYRLYLKPGEEAYITINVTRIVEPNPPRVEEVSYLSVIGFSFWSGFNRLAANILLSWIILPAVYLFILGVIASALAGLIGGARAKVPLKLW